MALASFRTKGPWQHHQPWQRLLPGDESSPGAAGSFTYEAVELVPAGAQTQAAW